VIRSAQLDQLRDSIESFRKENHDSEANRLLKEIKEKSDS